MKKSLKRLELATDLHEAQSLIDGILSAARSGKGNNEEKRLFLRHLLFNQALLLRLETSIAVDHLLSSTTPQEWAELFGDAVEKEFPRLAVELVEDLTDLDHRELLRLLPPESPKVLFLA